MNRVDAIRKTVYELHDDFHRLNYLTMMIDIGNANPLFNEEERQEYLEEYITVQKEVVSLMRSEFQEIEYKARLRKLIESYE